LKKQRDEVKASEVAKKKAGRQRELDKLKQMNEEESAKKKAAEEETVREKAMVRTIACLIAAFLAIEV